eukprot:TRINITY_DN41549_c0_g1_i1.p1 TRINITY_DN41549_c0_g1~~TRINITY_DN41549_c0_g1_i1.p1  ORF type:complete len:403 (-),score=76.83 TRINITY_DN41549_c0_g1_i1:145-1308(-)
MMSSMLEALPFPKVSSAAKKPMSLQSSSHADEAVGEVLQPPQARMKLLGNMAGSWAGSCRKKLSALAAWSGKAKEVALRKVSNERRKGSHRGSAAGTETILGSQSSLSSLKLPTVCKKHRQAFGRRIAPTAEDTTLESDMKPRGISNVSSAAVYERPMEGCRDNSKLDSGNMIAKMPKMKTVSFGERQIYEIEEFKELQHFGSGSTAGKVVECNNCWVPFIRSHGEIRRVNKETWLCKACQVLGQAPKASAESMCPTSTPRERNKALLSVVEIDFDELSLCSAEPSSTSTESGCMTSRSTPWPKPLQCEFCKRCYHSNHDLKEHQRRDHRRELDDALLEVLAGEGEDEVRQRDDATLDALFLEGASEEQDEEVSTWGGEWALTEIRS